MDIDSLESILRAYGNPIDRGVLQSAYDDPEHGPAFAEWTRLHLGPDNLLSKDELAMYSALDKSGEVDRLIAGQDLAGVSALSEAEMRIAIDELERSTTAITKQTETLKQQHEALARLVKANAKNHDARAELELKRAQRRNAERKKVTSAVEELSQSLDFRVSDLEQQSKSAGAALVQTVDDLLHSDDKLLSSLQKLGWELDTEDPEEQGAVNELREICMRLIKFTVETIRTRLDRLYLESLSATHHGSKTATATDDVEDVQEELESLYAEILPVAQMSVEQQYLEPALKSLATRNGQSLGRSSAAVEYVRAHGQEVLSCLDHLLDRTDRLTSRIATFQAHAAASNTLQRATRDELALPIARSPKRPVSQPPASPTRRRKSSGPSSPARTRANTGASLTAGRRRSSGAFLDEPPLDTLLRTLALPIPPTFDGSSTTLEDSHFATLSNTLADRILKAEDVARNAQEAFEDGAAARVADARRAIQLLRDSVLAESPFGAVRLVDPEIEGSIGVLGQETAKIKGRVDGVDSVQARGKSEKRSELVRTWG